MAYTVVNIYCGKYIKHKILTIFKCTVKYIHIFM